MKKLIPLVGMLYIVVVFFYFNYSFLGLNANTNTLNLDVSYKIKDDRFFLDIGESKDLQVEDKNIVSEVEIFVKHSWNIILEKLGDFRMEGAEIKAGPEEVFIYYKDSKNNISSLLSGLSLPFKIMNDKEFELEITGRYKTYLEPETYQEINFSNSKIIIQ